MDADAKQERSAEPRRLRRRYLVAGFPVWTYILAGAALVTWSVHGVIQMYGVDTASGWWGGFGDLMNFVMAGVLLVAGGPALLVEVWALDRAPQRRWLARVAVVAYIVFGCSWALLPIGLRFGGDTNPVQLKDLTLGIACYVVVVVTQAVAVFIACRWRMKRQQGLSEEFVAA
ncbi:hypothetical protein [Humibacillus xanthopallidus]|uniref:hypothetical protein n=1 Tax=Humibacillus xanthopallidus TaxID=412689 RepID=UPI001151F942|nr:hypothetical protein [Humibacillus xanthopallidus]